MLQREMGRRYNKITELIPLALKDVTQSSYGNGDGHGLWSQTGWVGVPALPLRAVQNTVDDDDSCLTELLRGLMNCCMWSF